MDYLICVNCLCFIFDHSEENGENIVSCPLHLRPRFPSDSGGWVIKIHVIYARTLSTIRAHLLIPNLHRTTTCSMAKWHFIWFNKLYFNAMETWQLLWLFSLFTLQYRMELMWKMMMAHIELLFDPSTWYLFSPYVAEEIYSEILITRQVGNMLCTVFYLRAFCYWNKR